MKRILSFLVIGLLAACGDGTQDPLVPEGLGVAGDAAGPELAVQTAPTDWIVEFRPGVADPPGLARRLVAEAGGNLRFTYQHTIRGFAATLPPQALEGIRRNPNVLRVNPDGIASVVEEIPTALWGLDRIDQRDLPLNGTYSFDTDGAGVTAYILDTGIRTSHNDFGGRAFRSAQADFIGGTGDDCHGHGTHVAGTVGGATYGVAKGVTLQAVRVLDCEGSGAISGVIAGVDWVTGQHLATGGPSVANMSLSVWDPLGWYQSLNNAVNTSVEAGVVFAVAASNENDDACDYAPAAATQALTVGATSSTDTRADFSNYGYCLDLFAPGVGITSAFNTGDDATHVYSGTSMASPHVAGVAALYLGTDPTANHVWVKYHIMTKATDGVVLDRGTGSPNKLLYSLITEDPPTDPEPPAAPSGLLATATSHSQISLAWVDNAGNEDGFEIWRTTGGADFTWIGAAGVNVTEFFDSGLSPTTTYEYQVRAKNSGGFSPFSNSASATTDSEPPQSGDITAVVGDVSETEIRQAGKFQTGTAGVMVVAENDPLHLLYGVTVTGDWYRDGDLSPIRTTSAVTGDLLGLGMAFVESGRVKNPPDAGLYFCVTSLSGPGYVDGGGTTYPVCGSGFVPPDPDDPGDPGDPGAPSGLTASFSSKGGGRVELAWTPGGGAEVDVFKDDIFLSTTADNGRYNDKAGEVGDPYQVCTSGTGPADPANCTETVTVLTGG